MSPPHESPGPGGEETRRCPPHPACSSRQPSNGTPHTDAAFTSASPPPRPQAPAHLAHLRDTPPGHLCKAPRLSHRHTCRHHEELLLGGRWRGEHLTQKDGAGLPWCWPHAPAAMRGPLSADSMLRRGGCRRAGGGFAAVCSVTRATACWLAAAVAMAVVWRSNAQHAGSQDLATVARSEVRPSLRGWFSGTGGAGWFWGGS
jgi:hypothetical protein